MENSDYKKTDNNPCQYDLWVNGISNNLNNFQNQLFNLFQVADGTNKGKILRTWPELFIDSKEI